MKALKRLKRLRLRPGMLTHAWELKLTALGLSLLLWAAVRSEDTTRFTMDEVPVQVRLTDDAWIAVGDADPATVTVDVTGPVRELIGLAFAEAAMVVPAEDVEDTVELYRPRPEWMQFERRFDNLRIDDVRPAAVRVRFQPIERRMVPIAVRLGSPLKANVRLVAPPAVEPERVLVEGPRDRVMRIDSLPVTIANVEAALRGGAVHLRVDTTGTGVTVSPAEVVVRLQALPDSTVMPTPTGAALH